MGDVEAALVEMRVGVVHRGDMSATAADLLWLLPDPLLPDRSREAAREPYDFAAPCDSLVPWLRERAVA